MIRRLLRGALGNPDPVAFMARLGRVYFGENYTETDRYKDFRKVFLDSPEGRRVLYQLIEMTHLYAPSFDPASPNPHLTHIHEGERNIGLYLMGILNADPNGFPQE